MLWRLFTAIRDLLLCVRDLLFGERPDERGYAYLVISVRRICAWVFIFSTSS
jgi:hypothetical protein